MSIDLDVLDDGIAVVTLNRPEKRNALDAEHYQALSEAWTRIRDDEQIRVAVVTGAGDKVFSAGADLKSWIGREVSMAETWQTQKGMLLNRGLEVWKPVVAAINGHCLAGGMTLMLATDIRVAADHATFALSEVRRGNHSCERWDAAAARATPACDRHGNAAAGRAPSTRRPRLAGGSSTAWCRRAIDGDGARPRAPVGGECPARGAGDQGARPAQHAESSWPSVCAWSSSSQRLLQGTEDAHEGRTAFAEKRAPQFKGK